MRKPLRLVLALTGAVVLALLVAVYAARKVIAREALVNWLHSKGVAAEADVQAIGLNGFVGRLRIGDPKAPDFAAETVDVRYTIKGFAIEVGSVTLRRPVMRGRLMDGRLSLGSLDPLIAEFTRRPPRPDQRQPRIEIIDGRALLATDYGQADLTADALVEGGKLVRLTADGRPMRLRGPGFDADIGTSQLKLNTRGDRVEISLAAPLTRATIGPGRAAAGQLTLTAAAPYPDLKARRGDGALVLNARLTSDRLIWTDQKLDRTALDLAFVGEARGWISDLRVTGRAVSNLTAGTAEAAGARITGLKIAATAQEVDWSRAGGDRISAALNLAGGFDRLSREDLTLRQTSAAFAGSLTADREAMGVRLTGAVNGRGAWTGLGAPTSEDSAEIAAVKRGLADFRIAAPGVILALDDRGPSLNLAQPARLMTAGGGQLSLTATRPGAYGLAMSGGGLPAVSGEVSNLVFRPGSTTAQASLKAKLSVGPLQQMDIDATGTVGLADGRMTFSAARCVAVKVARLEFGENDVEALAGRFCPDDRTPLVTMAGGGWRMAGQAEDVAASVPFLQARIAGLSGPASFGMKDGLLSAQALIEAGQVRDAAPEPRFNALAVRGTATMANEVSSVDLTLAPPDRPQLVSVSLRHDGKAASGGADIATGPLTFAPGGLQPTELSPMAAALGPPVTGQAEFVGRFDWTPTQISSNGALVLKGLDFVSPAGPVRGMSGEVGFSSLAPLIAASGQTLTADSLGAIVPLTDISATFALEEKALIIAGGEAAVGGGRVTVETLEVPLVADAPMRGTLALSGVQLHDLVEASPFGDKVELDAKVDGRVPFEAQNGTVKITGGTLRAIQPGRLSIQRAALTGIAASDAASPEEPVVPPNTVADFAYQAMENLAFDEMDATLASQDAGRLGVRFHILGRHDPPQRQEIRLGIMDLIRRDFLNKPLPLPSGVKVNLTLDTSLNLDDLLRDYGEYQRLRNSPPVQPPSAKTGAATQTPPTLEKTP